MLRTHVPHPSQAFAVSSLFPPAPSPTFTPSIVNIVPPPAPPGNSLSSVSVVPTLYAGYSASYPNGPQLRDVPNGVFPDASPNTSPRLPFGTLPPTDMSRLPSLPTGQYITPKLGLEALPTVGGIAPINMGRRQPSYGMGNGMGNGIDNGISNEIDNGISNEMSEGEEEEDEYEMRDEMTHEPRRGLSAEVYNKITILIHECSSWIYSFDEIKSVRNKNPKGYQDVSDQNIQDYLNYNVATENIFFFFFKGQPWYSPDSLINPVLAIFTTNQDMKPIADVSYDMMMARPESDSDEDADRYFIVLQLITAMLDKGMVITNDKLWVQPLPGLVIDKSFSSFKDYVHEDYWE